MDNYQKYLKYKTKYLNLKQMRGGGEDTHFTSILKILSDKLADIYKKPDGKDLDEDKSFETKCYIMKHGFSSVLDEYFMELKPEYKKFENIDLVLDNAIKEVTVTINNVKKEEEDEDKDKDKDEDERKERLQIVEMVGTKFIEIITKVKDESKKYYAHFIYLLFKKIFLENNNETFKNIISNQAASSRQNITTFLTTCTKKLTDICIKIILNNTCIKIINDSTNASKIKELLESIDQELKNINDTKDTSKIKEFIGEIDEKLKIINDVKKLIEEIDEELKTITLKIEDEEKINNDLKPAFYKKKSKKEKEEKTSEINTKKEILSILSKSFDKFKIQSSVLGESNILQ